MLMGLWTNGEIHSLSFWFRDVKIEHSRCLKVEYRLKILLMHGR